MIANTPSHHIAQLFTSIRSDRENGYNDMSNKMLGFAAKQEGFLGVESARNEIILRFRTGKR